MTRITPYPGNFLQRTNKTALIIVKVDPQGHPEKVSYWENTKDQPIKQQMDYYQRGILMDIWT